MNAVEACRQLSAAFRDAAKSAASVRAPRQGSGGSGTPSLADALRRNDPEMADFLQELRRRGLVKG